MKLLLAILVTACASAPQSHSTGGADEALATTTPQPASPDDCGPQTHPVIPHVSDHPVAVGAEVSTTVVAVALDEDHQKQLRDCRDRAGHDQGAAAIQQQRAAAVNESTPALVQRIQAAARGKDCRTVHALEGSLDDRDPAQHDEVYGHDPDVLRCAAR